MYILYLMPFRIEYTGKATIPTYRNTEEVKNVGGRIDYKGEGEKAIKGKRVGKVRYYLQLRTPKASLRML